MRNLERRREAWSSYWAAGGLHSCIGNLVEDRDGAIACFWRACFAQLREGERVLDLATGNGAVPKLLLEIMGPGIRVDAVDLAVPNPAWYSPAEHASVTFHPGVEMEALPFAPGGFDLVVSQFGLEYAQWPAALDEAARMCREQGRLALVMHHADSVVVRRGRIERSHQELLLDGSGLVAAAIALLPHLARVAAGGRPDDAANQAREAYNEAMRVIGGCIQAGPAPDLLVEARQEIHSILGGRFGIDPGSRHAALLGYARALVDASIRTRELIDCALDDARAESLVLALRERLPGRRVERVRLEQGPDVVAWGVSVA